MVNRTPKELLEAARKCLQRQKERNRASRASNGKAREKNPASDSNVENSPNIVNGENQQSGADMGVSSGDIG